MRKIAVISGKGGTGKTMVTAAFADLLPGKKILVDADVDAANLAILVRPVGYAEEAFFGHDIAQINHDRCIQCGKCVSACRFEAICEEDKIIVIPYRCEGCGVCRIVCPVEAVELKKRPSGMIFQGRTAYGDLIHAELNPGAGNSGHLVHQLRKKAEETNPPPNIVLIDGPPGIGCPMLSTVTGVSLAVMVTEPSRSALADLIRLDTVCCLFRVERVLVINRFDLNSDVCREISDWATNQGIPLLGMIPYDPQVVSSVRSGMPVTHLSSPAGDALRMIAGRLEGFQPSLQTRV